MDCNCQTKCNPCKCEVSEQDYQKFVDNCAPINHKGHCKNCQSDFNVEFKLVITAATCIKCGEVISLYPQLDGKAAL